MNTDNIITASKLKYLFAIYLITKEKHSVHSVEVAEKLNVTKPSTHSMINHLCNMGLTEKEKYGTVHLTEEGKKIAIEYYEYYEILSKYLKDDLFVEDNICSKISTLILTGIDKGEIKLICEKIGRKHAGEKI